MMRTPEMLARHRKAAAFAEVLREAINNRGITLQDIKTRDTGLFWKLVRLEAKQKPPSTPGEGIYAEISPETRALVIEMLEDKQFKEVDE